MAVLYTVLEGPVEQFFYATPPRWVVPCIDRKEVLEALQEKKCHYALVPEGTEIPEGLEVRTCRPGFKLLQQQGRVTRSDRRARQRRERELFQCEGPPSPYWFD